MKQSAILTACAFLVCVLSWVSRAIAEPLPFGSAFLCVPTDNDGPLFGLGKIQPKSDMLRASV